MKSIVILARMNFSLLLCVQTATYDLLLTFKCKHSYSKWYCNCKWRWKFIKKWDSYRNYLVFLTVVFSTRSCKTKCVKKLNYDHFSWNKPTCIAENKSYTLKNVKYIIVYVWKLETMSNWRKTWNCHSNKLDKSVSKKAKHSSHIPIAGNYVENWRGSWMTFLTTVGKVGIHFTSQDSHSVLFHSIPTSQSLQAIHCNADKVCTCSDTFKNLCGNMKVVMAA